MNAASGFATESKESAHRFRDVHQANDFANHFRGMWRGFARFDPENISVEAA